MFIPTTKKELDKLNWKSLDIIIITGDTYIDAPSFGTALIGKLLLKNGYKVGIIAQPDIDSDKDIKRLGEPSLFWGITSGCMDSIVANYTSLNKFRKKDDLTPGGINNKRPDRAIIMYTNLIKRYFKNTKPIVLGGLEASLKRIPHYDFKDNKIKNSILFDSKADFLIYGMAEKSILKFAENLKKNISVKNIKNLCYISKTPVENFIKLPDFTKIIEYKKEFIKMFDLFYKNTKSNSNGLFYKNNNRYLIINPVSEILSEKEIDNIYSLNFERDVHPFYKKQGIVKALSTIQFSITTHRGCYGECNFCSITVHQGKNIISRSIKSIIDEAKSFRKHPDFKGIISDVGGPTANMYKTNCKINLDCSKKRCLGEKKCDNLDINHIFQLKLLKELSKIKGIKKIFIGSGIRYDLILKDKTNGLNYLKYIIKNNISGQLKIAPEHNQKNILQIMNKPFVNSLIEFKNLFDKIKQKEKIKCFLTYYFIAAHPDCSIEDMHNLKKFIQKNLKITPEQVQIFTPTASTYSTLAYYTELNPFNYQKIFVEKNKIKKEKQKKVITENKPNTYLKQRSKNSGRRKKQFN